MHGITTALATLAVALAIALRSVNAYGNGGLSADVCNTFGVYHEANRRPDTSKDVYLTLFGENGEPQNCFMPRRNYYVKLNSSYLIRGFLLQAVSGARMPSPDASLPGDVTDGPCRDSNNVVNSVSHTQKRTERSEELYFPISIKKSTRPLLFRYTVVFSFTSFLADKTLEIPCCERLNQNATLPSPTAISGSGTVADTSKETGSGTTHPTTAPYITLPSLGTPANRTCGRRVENVNKSLNDTRDGIRYNCTIKRPLKQTVCEESCEIDGQRLRCQVYKHIPRRKGYNCVPYTDCDQTNFSASEYRTTFEEIVTTGCQCFIEETTSSPSEI